MDEIILIFAVILLISVITSKFAKTLGVPALLAFILIGVLAGYDVFNIINFKDYKVANFIGVISLVFILFTSGLSVNTKYIKKVFLKGSILATFGVFVTALVVGLFSKCIFKMELFEALLLGSIVSSTDAAAVFGILRSKKLSLKPELKTLLEFESGSNDPMAVFLTMTSIGLILGNKLTFFSFLTFFALQMGLGVLFGFIFSKIFIWTLKKIELEYTGLYAVLGISFVLLAYSSCAKVGANGFICVYAMGLFMASKYFKLKAMFLKFNDGIAWLFQVVLFVVLGLLAFVGQFLNSFSSAILISLVLIFIARPVCVFLSLIPFKMPIKEKLLLSWVGLRGAAPIVLATFPLSYGIKNADEIFNVVFIVVIISVLVQGTTIPSVSMFLGLDEPYIEKNKLKHLTCTFKE